MGRWDYQGDEALGNYRSEQITNVNPLYMMALNLLGGSPYGPGLASSVFGPGTTLNILPPVGRNLYDIYRHKEFSAADKMAMGDFGYGKKWYDAVFGRDEYEKMVEDMTKDLPKPIKSGIEFALPMTMDAFARSDYGKMVSKLTLGYDPEEMGRTSLAQRRAFLNRGEFMGAGGTDEEIRRVRRLTDQAVRSRESLSDRELFRDLPDATDFIEAAQLDRDQLYRALANAQAVGVRDIFDASTGEFNIEGVGGDWAKLLGATGGALGTSDADTIIDQVRRMLPSGKLSDIKDSDVSDVKDKMERIRKIAQFLGVSSSEMIKTANLIQDTIRDRTGAILSTSTISEGMAKDYARGIASGMTSEEATKVVAMGARDLTAAMGSDARRKLAILAHHGDAWALDVINNRTTVTSHEVSGRFQSAGFRQAQADDRGYVKRLTEWGDSSVTAGVDEVVSRSAREEVERRDTWAIDRDRREYLRRVRGVTRGGRDSFDKSYNDALLDQLGLAGIDQDLQRDIRGKVSDMRKRGVSEYGIRSNIRNEYGISAEEFNAMEIGADSSLSNYEMSYSEVYAYERDRLIRSSPGLANTPAGIKRLDDIAKARTKVVMDRDRGRKLLRDPDIVDKFMAARNLVDAASDYGKYGDETLEDHDFSVALENLGIDLESISEIVAASWNDKGDALKTAFDRRSEYEGTTYSKKETEEALELLGIDKDTISSIKNLPEDQRGDAIREAVYARIMDYGPKYESVAKDLGRLGVSEDDIDRISKLSPDEKSSEIQKMVDQNMGSADMRAIERVASEYGIDITGMTYKQTDVGEVVDKGVVDVELSRPETTDMPKNMQDVVSETIKALVSFKDGLSEGTSAIGDLFKGLLTTFDFTPKSVTPKDIESPADPDEGGTVRESQPIKLLLSKVEIGNTLYVAPEIDEGYSNPLKVEKVWS